MEVENQVSFISPMLQKTQFGNIADETTITFKEDADTPMTIDASAPGDVIELSDDFDFDGYQVFYPQIGVKPCSMAGGGVSKNIWNCFRTAPEGTGQPLTCSTSGMGLRLK